ncbi:MAG: TldD/PmbA family protein [Acidobacteriota bacterium]|nr:MAG: TldD/PmbA family protein [Acidobacteriota bacterium]
MLLGESRLFEVLRRALEEAPGDAKEALFIGSEQGLTRYAESCIHQNMLVRDRLVSFRIAAGKRIGTASTSSLEEEDLRRTAQSAFEAARHQPEIPHFEGFPAPSPVRRVKSHFAPTARTNARARARAVKGVFDRARKSGVRIAGSFATAESEVAVLNSNGLARHQPFTSAAMTVFALSDSVSGYADAYSCDVRAVEPAALAERAIEKCLRGRNPKEIPPGRYDVVLEPTAVSEVMEWFSFTAFNPKAYDDGMSFLEGRKGKRVMGENVTIYDDGLERGGLPMPFDYEGSPKRKVTFVRRGRGRDIVCDSLYGAKLGRPSTGHALPPGDPDRAMPLNLFMEAGDSTEEEMLLALDRGVWVTKFHYLNGYLEPKQAVMTGMTRDGAFWVEGGKIQSGIANMRFTQGMLEAFSNIERISKKRRPIKTWWSDVGANTVPALLIRNFAFTGRQETSSKTPDA